MLDTNRRHIKITISTDDRPTKEREHFVKVYMSKLRKCISKEYDIRLMNCINAPIYLRTKLWAQAYNMSVDRPVGLSGTIEYKPETFFDDMFEDNEIFDLIEYNVETQKMDVILPDDITIIRSLTNVGPYNVSFVSDDLASYHPKSANHCEYILAYDYSIGISIRKIVAEAMKEAHLAKTPTTFKGIPQLSTAKYGHPSATSDLSISLIDYNEDKSFEDLMHEPEGLSFRREKKVNVKLAVELEETVIGCVNKLIKHGYYYKMLRSGGIKIKSF